MKTSDTSCADNIIPGNTKSRNCASDNAKAKDLLPGDNVQYKSLTESDFPGSNSSEISREDKIHLMDVFNSIDFDKIIDHPNILIAAHFWDEDRYQAAKVCYRFMRAVDDLVDNYKSDHKVISDTEREKLESEVSKWISFAMQTSDNSPGNPAPESIQGLAGPALSAGSALPAGSAGSDRSSGSSGSAGFTGSAGSVAINRDTLKALTSTMERFHIPLWPFEAFARSMIYDIYNDGFPTLQAFLDYSAGASVAPASIFVHLSGLRKTEKGYQAPAFDVREVATPCAIFSYLVHIIRDFVKDHTSNLNYFPLDLMKKYDLNRENLLLMALGKTQIAGGFRSMISDLYSVADEYRLNTLKTMKRIEPLVEPRSRLSLRIIFDLYSMVFERIDIENGNFTTAELNPTAAQIKERVRRQLLSE
ncbi:MAG: squalene/phytoene synthase family protein [Bacteroidales bacterium]|nr:squalene/phytoene synthase family protein [Bacteroidales bacterium]MDD2426169.1 squalene/phytoene synthase family protein [Bacteroidales bacterium]MDD3989513.1 squalene/phytoene synthase family protein [Bacteroidales bacterium]MDD4639110.1 squalene/phytoene synthase family protein [Bacteroidales bacterium]